MMGAKVLVVTEQRDGGLNRVSWELLVAAQRLAKELNGTLASAVLGSGVRNVEDEIAAKGVGEVILVEHALLAQYTPDGYSQALQQVIMSEEPELVLFSHTYRARDYVAKLATMLGKPLLSDCIRYRVSGDSTVWVRQVFQGKVDADFVFTESGPNFVSFQTGAFNADDLQTGPASTVRQVAVELDKARIRTDVLEVFEGVKQEVDLSKAERIISVGRGIKKEENMQLIKQLAEVLDAELAASRPVVDDGWLPQDRQIGSSGQTVSPKLYLAVGISGAIQHIVGMKNAETIVAINKDPYAPIFDIADYAVVGDLFEVVPELISAIKAVK
jgi:electron transfer flavoprotein alpha subunit